MAGAERSRKPKRNQDDEEPALSTRATNKQRRRDRILLATATIVCHSGVDSVRLATVAEMAKVTVPTIHNLFGKKQDVFNKLIEQVVEWMIEISEVNAKAATLDEIERGVENLFTKLKQNELQFKAGYMIGERFGHFGLNDPPYRHASATAVQKYQHFVDAGDLNGNLTALCLAEFVNNQYRLLRSDWVRGELTTAEFKKQFLWSFYVILMADAGEKLRKNLLKRLSKL